MNFKNFLKECQEKEVFKRLSIYIVSSWVLIQVFSVIVEPLSLPKSSLTILLLALITGLPLYIFLIWKFRLADLEKKKDLVTKKGKRKHSGFEKTYFTALLVITGIAALASSYIIKQNFLKDNSTEVVITATAIDKIVILSFGNNSGDSNLDMVGKMASDWIMHGITENKVAQVVSPEVIEDYAAKLNASFAPQGSNYVATKVFKPSKIITGNYYLNGNNLIFQCAVKDGNLIETLIALKPVSCPASNPLACIETLNQRILGFLITENKQALNLQESPPLYEAYQAVINAKQQPDRKLYLELLNKAIALDSTYFEPQVLRAGYYYNQGEFNKSDSLLAQIKQFKGINPRQLNLIQMYEALLKGENSKVYETVLAEYQKAPFDMATNSGAMVVALQYVNKPEDVDQIYTQIPSQEIDLEACGSCTNRIYVKAHADIQLKNYSQAVALLKASIEQVDNYFLNRTYIRALVRTGKFAELKAFLSDYRLKQSVANYNEMQFEAAKELKLVKQDTAAAAYFDALALSFDQAQEFTASKALYYFLTEQYGQLIPELRENLNADSNSLSKLTMLAISYAKIGNPQEAVSYVEQIEAQRAPYQYGSVDYHLAQYYAMTNQKDKAINALLKAVASGYIFDPNSYGNDFHFVNLKEHPKFNDVLTYWH